MALETFDGISEEAAQTEKPKHCFWGSVRMTYTICAFLAMVLQLCMRNTLNFVILCMVKHSTPEQQSLSPNLSSDETSCGSQQYLNDTGITYRSGDLNWTRHQEISLQGTFYYGYIITLPIAGRLADKFGGKLCFVHSITLQALVFMLIPVFARISYAAVVVVRVLQGIIAGCGNPALYQLFSTWAHTTERTALLSFAYSGYSVGSLLIFPISSFLCQFGWDTAFYVVGAFALLCGICFHFLVYSSLEDHPRLKREEYEYLKAVNDEKCQESIVPWKSILTSIPVYAFTFTHIFHTYGIIVFSLMIPRFFKETMGFSLREVGLYSAVPFLGSFVSTAVTVLFFRLIERIPNLNLTIFRRIVYVLCNCLTILFIVGIIYSDCKRRVFVVLFTFCIGIATDLGFSGTYWPSLLYVAPSYTGLLSGMANCLATLSGFLAPIGISNLVQHGTKSEWNYVMLTLIIFYSLGAIVYGGFGSSKLQQWDKKVASSTSNNNEINNST